MSADAPFVDFSGRWIALTGASSGIGRAIAVELVRRSARLILIGRNEANLAHTASLLPADSSHTVVQDLREVGSLMPIIRDHVSKYGRIYGLCYCSGIVETRPLASFQAAGFRDMVDVNVTAGLELARAVCRRDVLSEDGGALLFITSIYGNVGMPGQMAYSATKGALQSAARSLAIELARRQIRVNTLSPGLVRTPMTEAAFSKLSKDQVHELEAAHPLGTGSPEDVARGAAFLLAPQSRWITGTDLVIDGGYTAR
jgi:NAD(P)-dependent dehydrogenase (short-subunit alcohol dehydrogenase family)